MEEIIRKIKNYAPSRPGIRFNTISGTTSIRDFFIAFSRVYILGIKNSQNSYINRIKKSLGVKYAYLSGSGRMGLYSILEALDIGVNDEVIIPAYTCVVVPNAILYKKAVPIYVDINLEDFNIDAAKIESAITKDTKAIYAQHTFGLPCNIEKIRRLAQKYNLYIIEDAAHSFGGSVGNKKIGTLGDIAFFSTDHTKFISTYLGGIITTDSKTLAKKIENINKNIENLSFKNRLKIVISFLLENIFFSPYLLWIGNTIYKLFYKAGVIFGFSDELMVDKPQEYPYPCNLGSFQSEVGINQIKNIEKNTSDRFEIIKILNNLLGLYNYNYLKKNNLALLRYSFMVKDRQAFEERFSKYFDLQIWFTSVTHMRNKNYEKVMYKMGSCPNAEFAAKHVVNFPTHSKISKKIIYQEVKKNSDWIKSTIINK
jgi:dTDP-4-amino-4,6-dideoxygalactose transaminase